jgi:NAD+ kinase
MSFLGKIIAGGQSRCIFKKIIINQPAQGMPSGTVYFLYKRCLLRRHRQGYITQPGHGAVFFVKKHNTQHALPPCRLHSFNHAGAGAWGKSQQHVPFFAQGLYLKGKNMAERAFIGYACEQRHIGCQRKGWQGGALKHKAVGKGGGKLLRHAGTAASAAQKQGVAPAQSLGNTQCRLLKPVRLPRKKSLAQACPFVGILGNNVKHFCEHGCIVCYAACFHRGVFLAERQYYNKATRLTRRLRACSCGHFTVIFKAMKNTAAKKVLIVVKADKPGPTALAQTIEQWLMARGCSPTVLQGNAAPAQYAAEAWSLVIVLGGDGTMLGVARHLLQRPVPIMGINFGRVGFLTVIQPEEWQEALEMVLAGKAIIHPHMALRWQLQRGEERFSGAAFNDVVICRGAMSRVSIMDLFADDEPICQLRADGVIISSPVGSTAYTVSAGGPLVHPAVEALTVTPICPFLYRTPSMVLPASVEIKAIMHEGVETYLTADGQEGTALEPGDVVTVQAVPHGVLMVMMRHDNYFERLGQRGFLGKLPRMQ